MKTRLELRTQELDNIGRNRIDLNFSETQNVDTLTRRIENYQLVLSIIDKINNLKYSKVEASGYAHSCYTNPFINDGILDVSFSYNMPIKNDLKASKEFLKNEILKAEKIIEYWKDVPINVSALREQGRLYFRNDEGKFKKVPCKG